MSTLVPNAASSLKNCAGCPKPTAPPVAPAAAPKTPAAFCPHSPPAAAGQAGTSVELPISAPGGSLHPQILIAQLIASPTLSIPAAICRASPIPTASLFSTGCGRAPRCQYSPPPAHSPDPPPRHTANEKNVCRHRAITLSAGMVIKVHPCPANQSDHHDRNRIFQSV